MEDVSRSRPPKEAKIDLMQIVSLFLSVYVLGALVVQTVVPLSKAMNSLLDHFDFVICIFFLFDFFLRLYQAKSKLEFLKWGWIDFISSIPVLPAFQWARIARVVRIIRLLRAFRSTKVLLHFLFRHRGQGALSTAILVSIVMMIFSSIAILDVEKAPNSNIRNPEDAIWWAFTTVTTVGYGDKYPVTAEGRVVAALLMVSSVGLFGIFTGFVASCFVSDDKKHEKVTLGQLAEEIRLLREKVEELANGQEPHPSRDTAKDEAVLDLR